MSTSSRVRYATSHLAGAEVSKPPSTKHLLTRSNSRATWASVPPGERKSSTRSQAELGPSSRASYPCHTHSSPSRRPSCALSASSESTSSHSGD
eukprot:scaffold115812_cov29-Tisochrysis_lutea.AAC.3